MGERSFVRDFASGTVSRHFHCGLLVHAMGTDSAMLFGRGLADGGGAPGPVFSSPLSAIIFLGCCNAHEAKF